MNPGVAASRQSAAIRGNNSQRRSAETPLRGRFMGREQPLPGACFAHTGPANSVVGMARRRRRILPLPRGAPADTAIELSPAAGPHWQALNLNLNRNLARLRILEVKSKITIKIRKKPFRLNSMAVAPGERAEMRGGICGPSNGPMSRTAGEDWSGRICAE